MAIDPASGIDVGQVFPGMMRNVTGASTQSRLSKLKEMFSSGKAKAGVGGLLAVLAMERLLSEYNQAAERGVQREAIRGQGELATPENLYYQAAMPTAQAEEEQARQALFAQISGGVLGPTLAKGERLIGR